MTWPEFWAMTAIIWAVWFGIAETVAFYRAGWRNTYTLSETTRRWLAVHRWIGPLLCAGAVWLTVHLLWIPA